MFLCSLRIIPRERRRRRRRKMLINIRLDLSHPVRRHTRHNRGGVIRNNGSFISPLPNRHFARHAGEATLCEFHPYRYIPIYTSTSFSNWLFHRATFDRATPREKERIKRKKKGGKKRREKKRRRKGGKRQKTWRWKRKPKRCHKSHWPPFMLTNTPR